MEYICNAASYWKWPLLAVSVCSQLLVVSFFSFFPKSSVKYRVDLSEEGTEIHITSSEFVRATGSLWWNERQSPASWLCSAFPHREMSKSLKSTLCIHLNADAYIYGFLKLGHAMYKTETESQFQNGKIRNSSILPLSF